MSVAHAKSPASQLNAIAQHLFRIICKSKFASLRFEVKHVLLRVSSLGNLIFFISSHNYCHNENLRTAHKENIKEHWLIQTQGWSEKCDGKCSHNIPSRHPMARNSPNHVVSKKNWDTIQLDRKMPAGLLFFCVLKISRGVFLCSFVFVLTLETRFVMSPARSLFYTSQPLSEAYETMLAEMTR